MKHLFIVVLLSICFISSSAQDLNKVKFTYGKEAVFVTEEGGADYVVVDFPGYTADSLYNKMMYYVNAANFVNDENIYGSKYNVKYIENERLMIKTVIMDAYFEKVVGINFSKNLKCRFVFRFKDGKLRIDAPIIEKVIAVNPLKKSSDISTTSFKDVVALYYNKEGRLKEDKERMYNCVKEVINKNLNEIITKSFEPKVVEEW